MEEILLFPLCPSSPIPKLPSLSQNTPPRPRFLAAKAKLHAPIPPVAPIPKIHPSLPKIPLSSSSSSSSSSFEEKLLFLDSLGVDLASGAAAAAAAWRAPIGEMRAAAAAVAALGLGPGELGRCAGMCPEILAAAPETIAAAAAFLRREAGVPAAALPRVIRRRPRLLVSSVPGRLRPTLYFLQTLGWEGSAGDMRVLRWACENGGFVVPEGKYYLVDSGYANTDRFLAPYRGERYHISQFDANTRGRIHRNPRDLYNHRHAQLRNMVEKTFGILKKRFKILNVATPFPYRVQCLIAMACCIIHNFIRRHQVNDSLFSDEPDEQDAEDEDDESNFLGRNDESRRGEDLRANITNQLWSSRT